MRMKEWYQRIKKRRGAKIARVAVIRRLATIIWHMLKHQQPYRLSSKPGEGNDPSCGCVPPDRNAFFKARQGRSKDVEKSCRGSEATATGVLDAPLT